MIAFSLTFSLLLPLLYLYGYNNTLRLWNVPIMSPHFADLRTITGGAESYAQGIDPMINNPGDPWGRRMNYPRVWQSLYALGVNQEHTTLIGISMISLFFIGVIMTLPNANYATISLVMLAVFSPATLLGVERGNIDLLIYFLVALSVVSVGKWQIISILSMLTSFVLKLFPIFCFVVLLRLRMLVFLKYALIVFVFSFFYACYTFSDLVLIRDGTPKSTFLSYGLNVFWMRAMAYNATLGWAARVIAYTTLFGFFYCSCNALRRKDFDGQNGDRYNDIFLDSFRAGASIYLGTFMLGNNWDYRLIFLIFSIPQLVVWVRSQAHGISLIASATIISVFGSLWYLCIAKISNIMPQGELIIYTLDEAFNWVVFGGLLYLLFWSMPGWLKEFIEKMYQKMLSMNFPSTFRPHLGYTLGNTPGLGLPLSDSIQHQVRRENLRQDLGLSPRRIEDIKGHPITAVLREIGGDRGVSVGPVALEIEDAGLREGLRHLGGAQGHPLVDQAGDTPGGGHVDEDGTPLRAGLGEALGGIGLAGE